MRVMRSMAQQKVAGASIHPRLIPDVVQNFADRWLPKQICPMALVCRYFIRSRIIFGMLVPLSAFKMASLSTESKAASRFMYVTLSGGWQNSWWISDKRHMAKMASSVDLFL